jgi:hypothetical protein
MYCYLSPLFRQRAARAAACTDAEQPEVQKDEEEKDSLLSWLHVRSRDRFSTAAHDGPIPKPTPRLASTPGLKRNPSSFTRGSLIPHLSPVMLTPPPPAYASRPSSPYAPSGPGPFGGSRIPSPLSSPRAVAASNPSVFARPPAPALPAPTAHGHASERTLATSRAQFDLRRTASPPHQTRRRSDTVPSPMRLAVRPFIAPRSVSAHTLHPDAADLPIPSRARVYTTGEAEVGQVSNIRRVARPREGAGLGLGAGIGLAERGRLLTRGPSASWVGGTGVGPRF